MAQVGEVQADLALVDLGVWAAWRVWPEGGDSMDGRPPEAGRDQAAIAPMPFAEPRGDFLPPPGGSFFGGGGLRQTILQCSPDTSWVSPVHLNLTLTSRSQLRPHR